MSFNKSFVYLLIMINLCTTCFITNCPPGGKRSSTKHILKHNVRQCAACGPSLKGRCFGPKICCDTEFGCHLTPFPLLPCIFESINLNLCSNHGKKCSNGGTCAAPGICCSSESCNFDSKCD